VTLPLLLLNSAGEGPPFGAWTDGVGIALWALGFLLETTADFQKYAFKSDAANKGRFIDAGLWRFARYPNYCGEIMLQVGVFVGCCAVFSGADWASVVAPLFTALLLLGVSGVPLQERQAAERWGGDAAYQEYKRRTWLLLPLPRPAFLRRRAA
jgi:steroid 5-alpha reductase family enzyme